MYFYSQIMLCQGVRGISKSETASIKHCYIISSSEKFLPLCNCGSFSNLNDHWWTQPLLPGDHNDRLSRFIKYPIHIHVEFNIMGHSTIYNYNYM